MPSVVKYPQRIVQVASDSAKISWEDTNYLKSKNSNYANTKLTSKNGKAKRLDLSGFNFNLPVGAEVTKIVIRYSYRKFYDDYGKYPAFAGPRISLKSSGLSDDFRYADAGAAPPKSYPKNNWTRTWNGKIEVVDMTSKMVTETSGIISTKVPDTIRYKVYAMPSRETVNNTNFGVSIQFPKNTSDNKGYIHFKHIEMEVFYKLPSYGLNIVATPNNNEFVRDVPFNLKAQLTNKNLTKYSPTLQIEVPYGTNLRVLNITNSTLVKSSETLWIWNPNINEQIGDVTLELECTIPSTGTKEIKLTELYNNTSKRISLEVIGQATPVIEEEDSVAEQILYALQNEEFNMPITVPQNMLDSTFYLYSEQEMTLNEYWTVGAESYFGIPSSWFNEDGTLDLTCKTSYAGSFDVSINTEQTILETPTFIVKVAPEGFTLPRVAILKLSDEETHRLGDTYNYVVSSDMRIVCSSTAIQLYQDYFRNLRLGVVNSIPETMNINKIYKACRNWSNQLTEFNAWETKEVEFVYNEDYPVYILLTGNFNTAECDLFELEFSTVKLIEKDREDGNNVLFPVPITEITSAEEESISTLALPLNNLSNNLIFYEFGLKETFQDKNNLAIRGVGVRVYTELDYPITISAKLKSATGLTGERSVIASVTNDNHIIGGSSDKWGFTVNELVDIEHFELELNFSNTNNEDIEIQVDKVELIIYYNYYEDNVVDWFVETENMAGLNCFLQSVEIPAGLVTDTKYLSVDGTDTNEAFRQNIQEKEITIEFDIEECNIDEAVATLSEITEFLQTERDNLYRPILKRIEFSHYPGLYWEYMMEDPIDAKLEGSSTFSCKIKLTIPSGTAYTKDEISTGKSGRVAGLAKVNPVIMVTPTDDHIEIEETLSNQKFLMTYNTWSTEDIVEIDCKNRKIYLNKSDDTVEDITAYADFNTDWLLLFGEFSIEETGCILQSVTWTERK